MRGDRPVPAGDGGQGAVAGRPDAAIVLSDALPFAERWRRGAFSPLTIAVAFTVFACLVLALVVVQAYIYRGRQLAEAEVSLVNLTSVVAEHARQTVETVDMQLQNIRENMPAAMLAGDLSPEQQRLLVRRRDSTPDVYEFFVLDADGVFRATSADQMPATTDFRNTETYLHHLNDTADSLHVDKPMEGFVGRATGRQIIRVSRRLTSGDGEFAGVVVAAMAVDRFVSLYESMNLANRAVVSLSRSDGVRLARYPMIRSMLGRSYTHLEPFRSLVRTQDHGTFTRPYVGDGLVRLSAFRKVKDYPLVVTIGQSRDSILASWWHRSLTDGAITALLVIAVVLFAFIGLTQAQRRSGQAEQISRRFRRLADASADIAAAPSVSAILLQVSDVARELVPANIIIAGLADPADHERMDIQAAYLAGFFTQVRPQDCAAVTEALARTACHDRRALRLTREQMSLHMVPLPGDHGVSDALSMRGWLGVPLVEGHQCIGFIQLADRIRGEFSDTDQAVIEQLARIATVAIANMRLMQENRTALASAEDARAEAVKARQMVEAVINTAFDSFIKLDGAWRFIGANDYALAELGFALPDLLGRSIWDRFPDTLGTNFEQELHRAKAEQRLIEFEYNNPRNNRYFTVRVAPTNGDIAIYFRDITEQKDTEQQLRQAQKMEAIGQLTGGVAHDFNNLLTVILGNAELLLEEYKNDSRISRLVGMTQRAANRGAELVRRLLAFARRQALTPEVVDVNQLVLRLDDLLRRTLGEHIQIQLVRGGGLWQAYVDPSQLENAILNLAINARDAMGESGKLTIETSNAHLDAYYAEHNPGVTPGQYVLVAVSDNGKGIPSDIIDKVFEPFFTTKEVGKGSGLGLSMVYGFVKQTGGHIKVYSEIDQGTSIKLYLPRAASTVAASEPRQTRVEPAHGTETILLVEDDEMVRALIKEGLLSLGYEVHDFDQAARVLEAIDSGLRFDLLMTDVVLPGGLNGRKLADAVQARIPDARVLYISGYTENAIIHEGRLDPGVQLLSKPFRREDMARRIRAILDA